MPDSRFIYIREAEENKGYSNEKVKDKLTTPQQKYKNRLIVFKKTPQKTND